MLTARLVAPGQLVVAEVVQPAVTAPGQVLVRNVVSTTCESGVCIVYGASVTTGNRPGYPRARVRRRGRGELGSGARRG